uniref:DUF1115 domain-containing protein n=1 Tax=Strongyloides stercoralis TaxID=6248 RepID=A0A0K0EMI8_STRER
MDSKEFSNEEESHTDETLPLDSSILKDVYSGKVKLKKNIVEVKHIGPLGDLKKMLEQDSTYFHSYIIFSNTIRSIINVLDVDSLPTNEIEINSNERENESRMSVTFAPLPVVIVNYNHLFFGEYDENPYKVNGSTKKKDIRDYSEADLERLMKQWDENDEDNDVEEEQKISSGNSLNLDEMRKKATNEEDLLKMSKKNQNVMMFVTVKDLQNPKTTKSFTEKITQRWQNNIYNNHINANVYVIEDNRAIFLFDEGSQSFEAREFLLQQKECLEVVLEGKVSKGLAYEKSEL